MRAFLSSTYVDLVEHRRLAAEAPNVTSAANHCPVR